MKGLPVVALATPLDGGSVEGVQRLAPSLQANGLQPERKVLGHAQAVLFSSKDEKRRARESAGGFSATERVVDYGTGPPPADGLAFLHVPRRQRPELTHKTQLLFLGRIQEKKGCDLLVRALAHVAPPNPDLQRVMAAPAEPTAQAAFQAQAYASGEGRCMTWLGMAQGIAKWPALYGSDAYVLPFHQKNCGIAEVEALACGLLLLASRKVNTWREMVADSAAHVAPDTAQGAIALLRRCLAMPPEIRAAMAAQASRTFKQRYAAEGAARSLLRELQQSVQTDGVRPGGLMRILHAVTSVDPTLDGVAESIRGRGVKLLEMGHTVVVVSMDKPDATFATAHALKIHALGRGYTAWQYHPRLAGWLRANCRRFDAVVVDGIWQYHGTATRRALKGTGVPYFVFPHGMLDPWFKRTYPLKHLKKWLFWPWADYRVLRDAKAVLFTCEEERRVARLSFWLYRATERLAPLGTAEPPANGAELAAKFLNQFPLLRGKPFLLFLGRLHPKKGCDLLLHGFATTTAQQAGHQLVMAGPADPTYLARLKAQAAAAGVAQNVHWLGMIQGDTKWGALFACEAFALLSHQENFGIAVAEALACGKPVLISNEVNIWREIVKEGAGLAEPDTKTGVRTLLQSWFGLPAARRAAAVGSARLAYDRHFAVQTSAGALLDAVGG